MQAGTYIEPSKTTLAQLLDRWLEDVRSRVTPKTHERYAQCGDDPIKSSSSGARRRT
jgi:hypothetical protein